jgi:hypothetical protein
LFAGLRGEPWRCVARWRSDILGTATAFLESRGGVTPDGFVRIAHIRLKVLREMTPRPDQDHSG